MAVLVAVAVLELGAPPSLPRQALEDGCDGGRVLLDHEVERCPPDDLVRRVAEHVLHPFGARGVAAAGVDLPDPVRGGQREVAEASLTVAQCDLDEPPLVDLPLQRGVGGVELTDPLCEQRSHQLADRLLRLRRAGRFGEDLRQQRRFFVGQCDDVCEGFGHGLRRRHSLSDIDGNRSRLKSAGVTALRRRDKMGGGAARGPVTAAVFKTVCGAMISSWVGSTPMSLRHLALQGRGALGRGNRTTTGPADAGPVVVFGRVRQPGRAARHPGLT